MESKNNDNQLQEPGGALQVPENGKFLEVRITDDDIIYYCQKLEKISEEARAEISGAIKARDLSVLSQDNYAFTQITALYLKHYRNRNLYRAVKLVLSLEKKDMAFILDTFSGQGFLYNGVSVEVEYCSERLDYLQGYLSNDLKPLTRVDEAIKKTIERKRYAVAHTPVFDAIIYINPEKHLQRKSKREQEKELSPEERWKAQGNPQLESDCTPALYGKNGTYDVYLKIANKPLSAWRASVKKMLMYSVSLLTDNNHFPAGKGGGVRCGVSFSYDEWLTVTGKENTKNNIDNVRKRIVQDCETLFDVTFKRIGRNRKKEEDRDGIHIFDTYGIRNGVVYLEFNERVALSLLNGYITLLPDGFFRLGKRNENAVPVAYFLGEHYFNARNVKSNKNNILSVESILDKSGLPTREAVKKEHARKYGDYIIKPFIKTMEDIAVETGMSWKFCNAGKAELSGGQCPDNIDDFLKLYILFDFQWGNGNED